MCVCVFFSVIEKTSIAPLGKIKNGSDKSRPYEVRTVDCVLLILIVHSASPVLKNKFQSRKKLSPAFFFLRLWFVWHEAVVAAVTIGFHRRGETLRFYKSFVFFIEAKKICQLRQKAITRAKC